MRNSSPSHRRRNNLYFGSLVLLIALIALSAPAQAADRWQIRAFGGWGNAGSGWEATEGNEFIRLETDSVSGWGLGLDYKFSPRLALEVGYLDSEVDSGAVLFIDGVDASDDFDIGFSPFTLGLGVNLLAGRRVDLVLSPQLTWINYGNPSLHLPEIDSVGALTLDDEVSWGLGLRLDVPLSQWLFSLGVNYYDATAKVTNPDIDTEIAIVVDPWIFELGIGYRF